MLAILKQVWNILVALPSLLKLFKEIVSLFKASNKQKVQETHEAFKEVKAAKTTDERVKAAKKIQSIIRDI